MNYNNEEQDELQKKFDLFIKAMAENMGKEKSALSPLPPISSSTSKNRLLSYININQTQQSVPLNEFVTQAAMILRDEFADSYLTAQEGHNAFSIELSNGEIFFLQITKMNEVD